MLKLSAEGDFHPPTRFAHEAAIERRRLAKKEIEDKYAVLMRDEYARRVAEIDTEVGRVMADAIAAGVPKGNIRRALKTNNNDVWRRYLSLVEVPEQEKPREVIYIGEDGFEWNFTARTVTDGKREWRIKAFAEASAPGRAPALLTTMPHGLFLDHKLPDEVRFELAERVEFFNEMT